MLIWHRLMRAISLFGFGPIAKHIDPGRDSATV